MLPLALKYRESRYETDLERLCQDNENAKVGRQSKGLWLTFFGAFTVVANSVVCHIVTGGLAGLHDDGAPRHRPPKVLDAVANACPRCHQRCGTVVATVPAGKGLRYVLGDHQPIRSRSTHPGS